MRGGGYQRRVMSFCLVPCWLFQVVVFGAGEKNHGLGFPRVIGRMLLEIEVSERGVSRAVMMALRSAIALSSTTPKA